MHPLYQKTSFPAHWKRIGDQKYERVQKSIQVDQTQMIAGIEQSIQRDQALV